jgi:hypothetical protein
MIKKSINPFPIIYATAVFIGFILTNIFLRKKLVNQIHSQQKRIELLELELQNVEENLHDKVLSGFFMNLDVKDLMEAVSEKRGFECVAIGKEVLKNLLDGENPENYDIQG